MNQWLPLTAFAPPGWPSDWPRHATIRRVSDPALLIYDPNDAASRSVVLSDWTGRGDLAGLERRWLSRRQLLAARPAIF